MCVKREREKEGGKEIYIERGGGKREREIERNRLYDNIPLHRDTQRDGEMGVCSLHQLLCWLIRPLQSVMLIINAMLQ